jgi:hypothetical protein
MKNEFSEWLESLGPLKDIVAHAKSVTPPFPNWEKSFISGTRSRLFHVQYFDHLLYQDALFATLQFQPDCEGPPGHVHGGASSALLDEALGTLVWHRGYASLTQDLHLHFLRPLPLDTKAYVAMRLQNPKDRKLECFGAILDSANTAYVKAEALFHHMTPEALDRLTKKMRTA